MLRDYFPQHKLNPSGANDDLNNPEPTRIWKALTEDVDGDAFAIVPWAHSYVGDSQQYWRGSAYYVQKQSVSNVNDGGFLITGSSDGPPLNGGNSSGYIRFRNPKIRVGANILRNFAGDPVDVLNGNMFRDKLDIAMPNVGVPLDFSRHYNSQSTFNVGLGVGWTHTFSDRLLQESGVTNELIWLTSEGVQHTFTKVAGNWELPLELFGQMQEVSGGYVYSDSDGLEHHFQTVTPTQASGTTNSIARVSKIVDRNGHGVEIQYPSSSQGFLPNSVQDVHSSSRRLDFTTASGNRHTAIKKYADDQLVGTWVMDTMAAARYLPRSPILHKIRLPWNTTVLGSPREWFPGSRKRTVPTMLTNTIPMVGSFASKKGPSTERITWKSPRTVFPTTSDATGRTTQTRTAISKHISIKRMDACSAIPTATALARTRRGALTMVPAELLRTPIC